MKSSFVFIFLLALLTACGDKQQTVSTNTQSTRTATKEPETIVAESPSPVASQSPVAATPTPERKDGQPPVEFTYLGVAPDKESIAFKIKVDAAEPISQVDIGIKYLDDAGKVVDETTLAWQNVVKSKRLPIEKGKTYEAQDYLPEGATKAECVLKRVIFADGTRWNAN